MQLSTSTSTSPPTTVASAAGESAPEPRSATAVDGAAVRMISPTVYPRAVTGSIQAANTCCMKGSRPRHPKRLDQPTHNSVTISLLGSRPILPIAVKSTLSIMGENISHTTPMGRSPCEPRPNSRPLGAAVRGEACPTQGHTDRHAEKHPQGSVALEERQRLRLRHWLRSEATTSLFICR